MLKMTNKTVLIIDDEEVVRSVTKSMLEEGGFSAYFANNGEEGERAYRELNPDCVLLDISMPKMGGEKCLSKIREYDSNARVVLFTGYNASKVVSELLDGDFLKGSIQKPFGPSKLIEVISEALREN